MKNETFDRIPYKTKEEWLKLRNNYIGGSDASCILGENQYKSILELWNEKVGNGKKATNFSNEMEDIIEYGTKAEEHLRELFKLTYKYKYKVSHSNDFLVSKNNKMFGGSLDGEILDLETNQMGVLEIKTARINNSIQSYSWKNQIPQRYFIQGLHYLNITNYDFIIYCVELRYEIDNKVWFKRYDVRIDRKELVDDLKYLEEAVLSFWNDYVVPKKQPNAVIPSF